MSRADLTRRNKGTALLPQKPGRSAARLRDQWIAERTPARRRALARLRLAVRVAKAEAARQAKAAA